MGIVARSRSDRAQWAVGRRASAFASCPGHEDSALLDEIASKGTAFPPGILGNDERRSKSGGSSISGPIRSHMDGMAADPRATPGRCGVSAANMTRRAEAALELATESRWEKESGMEQEQEQEQRGSS